MALTTQQLAQKLKDKYPQYADMDDAALVKSVTDKYPQYGQALVPEAPTGGVKNILGQIGTAAQENLPGLTGQLKSATESAPMQQLGTALKKETPEQLIEQNRFQDLAERQTAGDIGLLDQEEGDLNKNLEQALISGDRTAIRLAEEQITQRGAIADREREKLTAEGATETRALDIMNEERYRDIPLKDSAKLMWNEGIREGNINKVALGFGMSTGAFGEKVGEIAGGVVANTPLNPFTAFGETNELLDQLKGDGLTEEEFNNIKGVSVGDAITAGMEEVMKDPTIKRTIEGYMREWDNMSPIAQQAAKAFIGNLNLLDAGFVAFGVGTKAGRSAILNSLERTITKPVDLLAETGEKVGDFLGSLKEDIVAFDLKHLEKGLIASEQKAEDIVGQILQGGSKDIKPGLKALKNLDTTGIKTYKELKSAIKLRISTLSRKVDAELDKVTDLFKADDFKKVTPVKGGESLESNFVTKAMDDLDELYTNIGLDNDLKRVRELRNKLDTEGLTLKEANQLAREYGQEFKRKAFGANQQPLTSVNAQRFETTRKGIKNAVRDKMPNDIVKDIDMEMSNLFNTQGVIDKTSERLIKAVQKLEKKGFFKKVGALGADVINKLTGGSLKGFLGNLLPRGYVSDTMSIIQIEKLLKSNLKKLEKLTDLPSTPVNVKRVENLMEEIMPTGGNIPTGTAGLTGEPGGFDIPGGVLDELPDTRPNLLDNIPASALKDTPDTRPNLIDTSYQGTNLGSGTASSSGITLDNMFTKLDGLADNSKSNTEALAIIKEVAENPNAKITVYRATPGDSINAGDWVFLTKKEADNFTTTAFGNKKEGFKVLSEEVNASDIEWTNKNLEFVFKPNDTGQGFSEVGATESALIKEAQKYNTVQEFTDNSSGLFTGTSSANADNIIKNNGFVGEAVTPGAIFDETSDVISLSKNKNIAASYTDNQSSNVPGRIISFDESNLKIATEADAKNLGVSITDKEALKNAGFDGANISEYNKLMRVDEPDEIIVWNKDKLVPIYDINVKNTGELIEDEFGMDRYKYEFKPTNKLTDIYNKANK